MKTFTITQTAPKVMAREVNPFGEKPPVYFTDPDIAFISKLNHKAWQKAENNLNIYEALITKEDLVNYMVSKSGIPFIETWEDLIGQTITGEIISDNGTDKIKVV